MSESLALRGRWLFPADGEPMENACLTVIDGRIAAVGNKPLPGVPVYDAGNVAILPGFVNAHTHLDLTGMAGLAPPTSDFPGWLRQVIAYRRQRSAPTVRADVERGLRLSLACGVTTLGDVTVAGASEGVLRSAPMRSVIFHEILGLPKANAARAWSEWVYRLRLVSPQGGCRIGVSPHAPYSVRHTLFAAAARWAVANAAPVCVHLAESQAEMELVQSRTGPFIDFLQSLGVYDPGGIVESVPQLGAMFHGVNPMVWVHGNYLEPNLHAAMMRRSGATIIYCPRTHAAFGHPRYPLREWLDAGVRVAIATDSLASNPDLDPFAEVMFAYRRFPEIRPAEWLRLITLSGAEALGCDQQTGSLQVGKSADLCVIDWPRGLDDPWQGLFARLPTLAERRRMYRGRWTPLSSRDTI